MKTGVEMMLPYQHKCSAMSGLNKASAQAEHKLNKTEQKSARKGFQEAQHMVDGLEPIALAPRIQGGSTCGEETKENVESAHQHGDWCPWKRITCWGLEPIA
ncbi:unnamed protein product [Microthlaspi erraticum]|uniref:Uncharacterized protein n=1 Tax=Microthlaspi erraticum TaxID=1685480 RepID=A0A6D2JS37_9BRAS|nr:unnamed protein product [Microthlaspi erraticum]